MPTCNLSYRLYDDVFPHRQLLLNAPSYPSCMLLGALIPSPALLFPACIMSLHSLRALLQVWSHSSYWRTSLRSRCLLTRPCQLSRAKSVRMSMATASGRSKSLKVEQAKPSREESNSSKQEEHDHHYQDCHSTRLTEEYPRPGLTKEAGIKEVNP